MKKWIEKYQKELKQANPNENICNVDMVLDVIAEYSKLRAVADAAKAYKQEVILCRCAVDANKSMERFPKMIKAELNLEQALRAAGEENK